MRKTPLINFDHTQFPHESSYEAVSKGVGMGYESYKGVKPTTLVPVVLVVQIAQCSQCAHSLTLSWGHHCPSSPLGSMNYEPTVRMVLSTHCS